VSIVEESPSREDSAIFDRNRELHFEYIEEVSRVLKTDNPLALTKYITEHVAYQLAGEFIRKRRER
jgi:hypothetical protein